VAQGDGFKPREERGWEEFHEHLDLDADFPVFSADVVDGVSPAESSPGTPVNGTPRNFAIDSGALLDEALRAQQASQNGFDSESVKVGGANGAFMTPVKRRVGRPPRKPDYMLNGLGSPPAPKITPLPTMNPKEKLNLPKPSCREVDAFSKFEEGEGLSKNYVDRTMANIGYQESEVFMRPEKNLIRLPEGSIEEDLDLNLKTDSEGPNSAVAVGRVEYDMDEQDEYWLEQINAVRREDGIEAIKPAIFEVTITQIEKEWHALEKRESIWCSRCINR
jgi:NuA3 HAT complex component NTO1